MGTFQMGGLRRRDYNHITFQPGFWKVPGDVAICRGQELPLLESLHWRPNTLLGYHTLPSGHLAWSPEGHILVILTDCDLWW